MISKEVLRLDAVKNGANIASLIVYELSNEATDFEDVEGDYNYCEITLCNEKRIPDIKAGRKYDRIDMLDYILDFIKWHEDDGVTFNEGNRVMTVKDHLEMIKEFEALKNKERAA